MRLMLMTIRLLKVILRYVPNFTRYLGYTLAWFLTLSSTSLNNLRLSILCALYYYSPALHKGRIDS